MSFNAGQSVCVPCGVVSIWCGRESLFVKRTRCPRAIRGVALVTPFAVSVTVAPTAALEDGPVGLLGEPYEPPPHAGAARSMITATHRTLEGHRSCPVIVISPSLSLGLWRVVRPIAANCNEGTGHPA